MGDPEPAAASHQPPQRIAIVGLGLIGGSIALAARDRWPAVRIAGVDAAGVVSEASRRGIIDEAVGDVASLQTADLVVLAAPIPGILDAIEAAAQGRLPGIVTDVGSTKRQIMSRASAAGLPRFVGGHPLAGAAQGGLGAARADLFRQKPWLLEASLAPAEAVDVVEHFVAELGAMPRRIGAESHDRTMAYASHLPQLLASTLMATAGARLGAEGLSVSGPALREMTRLAASPPDVWRGILTSNADYISEALAAFTRTMPSSAPLDVIRWIEEIFREAGHWRERLEQPLPPVD